MTKYQNASVVALAMAIFMLTVTILSPLSSVCVRADGSTAGFTRCAIYISGSSAMGSSAADCGSVRYNAVSILPAPASEQNYKTDAAVCGRYNDPIIRCFDRCVSALCDADGGAEPLYISVVMQC